MKKYIGMCTLLLVVMNTNAQKSDKLFQKVTVGAIAGMIGTTAFDQSPKPFGFSVNLSANVTIVTPRTYHNTLYGLGNNSLRSLHGYFLKNDFDTYLLYSKILDTGDNYLGWGIEKMFKIENKKEGVKFFLLAELGTNFKGKTLFSLGMLTSIQSKIWKR